MSATPTLSAEPVVAAMDARSLIEAVPLWAWQTVLVVSVVASITVLYRVARPGGRWGQHLRSRLVLGVPWGTLLGLATVLGVYLFVQGGLGHRYDPVSLPFRATSYAYPLGIVLAGFSHLGWGHLLGNLFSGLVYGSIAEYAWSHFPTERGEQAFDTWFHTPFVRIGVFFLAILVAGLVTAAFSWGPIIGFSGVVYTLAGFGLVFYPLATIVAVVGWSQLWHLWGAFVDPYTIAEPQTVYSGVGWANTAVQGHAFGFLIGVFVAALIARRRSRSTSPGRIWLATLVYAIANGLWSVFWYLGHNQYARFEGIGTALLFGLAGVIVAVVGASDTSLVRGSDRGVLARLRDRGTGRGRDGPLFSRRRVAVGVIVFSLIGMSMLGAFINLSAPAGTDLPEDAVEVRDYQVAYAENITNQQLAVVDLPLLDQFTEVRTSGVVVYSDQRNLWHQVISKRALEARGSGRVLLGGIGWREPVFASRSGWSVLGGGVTYRVFLKRAGGQRRLVHTADPVTAELILRNRTISIRPGAEGFEVVVRNDNQTLGVSQLPADGKNVTVGGIRFARSNRELYAAVNGTRLRVANRRVPPTQR